MAADPLMPQYQCHKKVWALKIMSVSREDDGSGVIVPADAGFGPVEVPAAYMDKHQPEAGGYYVVYPGDHYESYSPAKAFEDGYTEIKHGE